MQALDHWVGIKDSHFTKEKIEAVKGCHLLEVAQVLTQRAEIQIRVVSVAKAQAASA